jgi:hypothetical protein
MMKICLKEMSSFRWLAECCRMNVSCLVAWNENKLRFFFFFYFCACTWHNLNNWIRETHLSWGHDKLPGMSYGRANTCGTPHQASSELFHMQIKMWAEIRDSIAEKHLKAEFYRSQEFFLPYWHKYLS